MKKSLSVILFFGLSLAGFSQNEIVGYAPEFIGQEVTLYTYQDYVTMNRVAIGEGTVRASDSSFTINFQANSTIKGVVEIGRVEGDLYIAPNTNYNIYFPGSAEPSSYQNSETNIYFSDLDTTDINYMVLQYHRWFDAFVSYNEKQMSSGGFLAYLDTFKLYAADAYKEVEDPFFITYVRYDIAEMEQTYGGNRNSEQRLETFLNYIEPFPVYYENDRYMKFILAFYDKEFREYLPVTEAAIMNAIYRKSPTLLMQTLKSDIFLTDPALRELVMVDKLGRAFYREIEYRPNIIAILDSVSNQANSEVNAAVARNVKKYITNLEPGYPAPAIQLNRSAEEKVSWIDYRGKFVYFNFFATWNEESMNDMEIISRLVPKYDEDIAFVSVCADKDSSTFAAFQKKFPEYDWDIFYVGEDETLMRSFKITSIPNYYLIDQDGFIFSAPALAPSPNGEYKSVEETLFKIKKALHPAERIRVGEK
ncbi:MAG: redoxin domain-containing protein [Crocinitomix sp.]|nr:redoxin domain-containing protein [Crocinitomix sp.]